jgi:Holliday junction resolvase RusA-like endonuclease
MPTPTPKETASPDYVLEVRMPLHSKARPRLTRSGHAYMAPAYKAAQEEMRRLLREQWPHEPLEGPLALELEVWGEGRGDADNIAGFIMDAAGPHHGIPGVLWNDDRVSVISALSIRWHKAPKKDSRWLIHITLLDGPLQ